MSPLKSVQTLWQDTYARLMKRWSLYLLFTLASLFLPAVIGAVGAGAFAFLVVVGGSQTVSILGGLVALALYIGAIYVSILFMLGMMQVVADDSIKGFMEAINRVKPKAGTAFLTALLAGIIIAVASLFLVLPGIYFAICYAFVLWMVLLENKKTMDALKASRALVVGRWFPVFGRFFAMGILFWLAVAIPQMLFVAIRLAPLAIVWQILATLVASPFFMIFGYVMYRNLKETRA